jgi:hypothetical protein
LLVFGYGDMVLKGMLWEFDVFAFEDVVRVTLEPFGKILMTIGRRAGMLTQIMPRLHSMTDRIRLVTLWSGLVSECMLKL